MAFARRPCAGARCGAGALCRLDAGIVRLAVDPASQGRLIRAACAVLVAGAAAYGFAFGLWRAPLQGVYSAAKLPALMLSVVAVSVFVNGMLALLLGARLTFRQVAVALLFAMAIAAAVLGSLSPVAAFLALQCERPPSAAPVPVTDPTWPVLTRAYGSVLLAHVAAIGVAGTIGLARLRALVHAMTGSRAVTARLLVAWFAVSGFVGCELAWLFSPFLCKPERPPHVISREYFQQNFYERVWEVAQGGARRGGRR